MRIDVGTIQGIGVASPSIVLPDILTFHLLIEAITVSVDSPGKWRLGEWQTDTATSVLPS